MGRPLEIPRHSGPIGPVTARLQRRWVVGYFALWTGSLLLLRRTKSEAARTAAGGLLLPGGGYLSSGRTAQFALTLCGVAAGFVAWVLVGMMFAPFAVWGASAALAVRKVCRRPGARPERPVTGIVAAGPLLLAGVAGIRRARFRSACRRRDELNLTLAERSYVEPSRESARPGVGELTKEDLAFQRYFLDRALQPVDGFDGFEWFDQYREAAVRYQLNYAQWALALSQYRCTPAFQGYLTTAQRRLIQRMTARRVWRYWWWENLWGNFRLDPDPIRRDNVMFSGYYGLMLSTYAAVSGDRRYDEPGCLEFRWNRRTAFRYDAASIAETIFGNMDRANYGLFPCEPNWVYPVCNMIGLTGLVAHDQVHGTGYAERLLPRFRHAVEAEFSRADGRPVTVRASRAGISIPGIAASTANDAAVVFWLSAVLRDVATRQWAVIRDRILGTDGRPVFQSRIIDPLDPGDYRPSWGPLTYGFGLAAAREMGDDEACTALEASLAEVAPLMATEGVAAYPGTVMANLMQGLQRLGGERAFHDLVNYGLPGEQLRGPVLADAPYPEVLVARAVSTGPSLDLVLYPGTATGGVTLELSQLIPDRRYRVGGADRCVTSDTEGRARVSFPLAGRVALTITPTDA